VPRAAWSTFVLCGWLFQPAPARAHHFTIDLDVVAGNARKTAHAEEMGLGTKAKVRAVVAIKAGTTIKIKWKLSNSDAKTTYKDVLVHFFVVKVPMLGQAAVPKLDKGVLAESALTMDFKPNDKSEGGLSLMIPEAGSYLLRLETIGAAVGKDGHEHFAALDLDVQGAK
jgi:hypothetical protein